jgi:hypothetical protein
LPAAQHRAFINVSRWSLVVLCVRDRRVRVVPRNFLWVEIEQV